MRLEIQLGNTLALAKAQKRKRRRSKHLEAKVFRIMAKLLRKGR